MTVYAVQYSYGPADLQAEHRPAHRAGAFLDGDPAGALLIFVAEDRDDLDRIIAADPMSTGGVLTGYTAREWNAVIGKVGK